MMRAPKSLTATIHVQFHYDEEEPKLASEGEVQMANKILEQASELEPEMQELIIKFAEYLNSLGQKDDGQSSD